MTQVRDELWGTLSSGAYPARPFETLSSVQKVYCSCREGSEAVLFEPPERVMVHLGGDFDMQLLYAKILWNPQTSPIIEIITATTFIAFGYHGFRRKR